MSVQIHFALLDTATALTFDTTLSTVWCFGFTVSAIDAEGILLLCFSMPVHFSVQIVHGTGLICLSISSRLLGYVAVQNIHIWCPTYTTLSAEEVSPRHASQRQMHYLPGASQTL